ncbi:hypothetical protein MD484_g8158, partial [Candolleomyces efflorescens]
MTTTHTEPEDPALAAQRSDASGGSRSNAPGALPDASSAGLPTGRVLPPPQAPLDSLGPREKAPPCPFGSVADAGGVDPPPRPGRGPYRSEPPPFRLIQPGPHSTMEGTGGGPVYRPHFGGWLPAEREMPTQQRPRPGPFFRPAYPQMQGGGGLNPFSFDPAGSSEPQYHRGYGAPYPVGVARQPLGHGPGGMRHDLTLHSRGPSPFEPSVPSPSPPPPPQLPLAAQCSDSVPATPENAASSNKDEFSELVADLSPNTLLQLTSEKGQGFESDKQERSPTPKRRSHAPQRITKADLAKYDWDEESSLDAPGSQASQSPFTPQRPTLSQQLFSSATPKPRRGRRPPSPRFRSLGPTPSPKVPGGDKRAVSELPDPIGQAHGHYLPPQGKKGICCRQQQQRRRRRRRQRR